jgi:ribonuclease HI
MIIHTDASFDEKKGIAGIGILVSKGSRRDLISNWCEAKSINEAELKAIYLACVLAGGEPCEIVTDSQTALQYIQYGVKDKPRTQEQYIRHKHCEFVAYKIRKFPNITFSKIDGHQTNFQTQSMGNRLAAVLANEGRAKFYER